MSRVVKTLALGVSLLLGQQALAQSVPQPQPVPFPSGGIPTASSGNGGLLLTLYDTSNTASLTLYTGLNYLDILPSTLMTSAGGHTLSFGQIAGFNELVAAASDGLTNLRYAVYSGDNNATGGATNTALATTRSVATSVLNSAVASALGSINSLTATINNSCGDVNPCTAVDAQTTLQGTYLGLAAISPTAALGTALGFYLLDHGGSTVPPNNLANITRYQNGPTSFGQWLLSSTGELSYTIAAVETVVPLPAAVWLLLSGLAGFGVIGRRRAA